MSDFAIRVEGLGKEYRISGSSGGYKTLRESLSDVALGPVRALRSIGKRGEKRQDESFWALKDVSFEVKRGEVVGVIGRNGAGKSTLLKVLSRITEPTKGSVRIRGRVGSLLEVGTGFHPELSGRENIFLNGAILGMPRSVIEKKFDEIVDFAEVEKFIDTPVKRYSSGMYLKLAFAVAAHLEPEILVVDEVLAVGDAAFQKKCLGKMNDVAKQGRTVLFVSHNMDAILRLCQKALLIDKGSVVQNGMASSVVAEFLRGEFHQNEVIDLRAATRTLQGRGQVLLKTATVSASSGSTWKFAYGQNIRFRICFEALSSVEAIELGIALSSGRGFEVASCLSSHSLPKRGLSAGCYEYDVEYLNLRLTPGLYRLGLGLRSESGLEDYIAEAFEIEVVPSELSSAQQADTFQGVVVPEMNFGLRSAPVLATSAGF